MADVIPFRGPGWIRFFLPVHRGDLWTHVPRKRATEEYFLDQLPYRGNSSLGYLFLAEILTVTVKQI